MLRGILFGMLKSIQEGLSDISCTSKKFFLCLRTFSYLWGEFHEHKNRNRIHM